MIHCWEPWEPRCHHFEPTRRFDDPPSGPSDHQNDMTFLGYDKSMIDLNDAKMINKMCFMCSDILGTKLHKKELQYP